MLLSGLCELVKDSDVSIQALNDTINYQSSMIEMKVKQIFLWKSK